MDIVQLLWIAPGGLVIELSPGVREVVGLIPGWVMPKTLKMVFDASLLSAQHLKDRSWPVPLLSTIKCVV